jgi:hypothetical protein
VQKKEAEKTVSPFDILVGVQSGIESINQFCVAQLRKVGSRHSEVKHGV